MRIERFCIIALFMLICIPDMAICQNDNDPVMFGCYRKIVSKASGEEHLLLISLPSGYEESDKSYPALYLLDGSKEIFFQHASTVWYLSDVAEKIPGYIVVGIPNTDRGRDFGREREKFYRCLKDELIPFVEANYKTNGFKVLCGQSAGSVFAFYAFLQKPDLFDAVFLVSFGISDGSLGSYQDAVADSRGLKEIKNTCLFVTNAINDPYDPSGERTRNGKTILELLYKTLSKTNRVMYTEYAGEGHVPFPSVYDGFKWLYEKGGN